MAVAWDINRARVFGLFYWEISRGTEPSEKVVHSTGWEVQTGVPFKLWFCIFRISSKHFVFYYHAKFRASSKMEASSRKLQMEHVSPERKYLT